MAQFDKTVDLDPVTKKNVMNWLSGDYDPETKGEIERLLRENPQEITDAFYTNLEFGTAGLRGIMGVGTNRMNPYTVGAATQGLANYLKQQPANNHSVFIGYDSRHHSRDFAEEAAKVLAGNGIKVYLTQDIRPTPLVSFGCRYLNSSAGIMITASHNPPAYNGYKVYWNDGGQILPPHDKGIIEEARKITETSMVHKVNSINNPLIQEVGQEIDEAYYAAITPLQHFPLENKQQGSKLKIVYTSLHGTGITLIKKALNSWGFTDISFVEKQVIPNGDFPTAPSPNPEEHAALKLGIEQMEHEEADLLIATDPDADRIGVAIRHRGETIIFNGNQMAAILMEHVCESLSRNQKMPERGAFIKTVVTTEIMQAIADHYNKPLFNVLTGFKYIAAKLREWEKDTSGYQFLFGGEESYGYLLGTEVRDKDAIVISCLVCEAALHAKLKGYTLYDFLENLFAKYGTYVEMVKPIKFEETKAGKEQMAAGMATLRKNPPQDIAGISIKKYEDYLQGIDNLPKANILAFWLEDGSKIMIRPSGTEPKVKIYCGAVVKNASYQSGEKHAQLIIQDMEQLFLKS